MLVHYYKTKFEVSGEDAPLNFLTSLYRIQSDRKSAIISMEVCNLWQTVWQTVLILLLDWAS